MVRHFTCTLLVLSACSSPAVKTVKTVDGHRVTAIVDVSLVPLDSERILSSQTVLVRDGLITKVGPAAEVAVPAGAQRVDGRGKFLLPGLADMHTHVQREEDLLLYVARGVTTVRNMWGAPIHVEWRERIKKGELVGPSLYTSGPILDADPPVHDGSLVVTTDEEAERAIAQHKAAGYDFVKVYSRLSAPAYQRLVAAAKKAGFLVAGHTPRAVGLGGVMDARQDSVEHLGGFLDALQTETSPVRGTFDRKANARKPEFVDPALVPALVTRIADTGLWNCPTLTVVTDRTPAETRQHLQRPQMKYVAPMFHAMWDPGPEDAAPDVVAAYQRNNQLNGLLIRALRDAHAGLLVGTDPANPLVVPGYSVHDELALLVAAGLTPLEALRAATHEAARFQHAEREWGSITPGLRADLLLIQGNPLTDITQTANIAGVMARGRWFSPNDLDGLLARVETTAQGDQNPFTAGPPFAPEGTREQAATFSVTWKGARFGVEELVVDKLPDGQRLIRARRVDGESGQRTTLRLEAGADGEGSVMTLHSDGPTGRGNLTVKRADGRAVMTGALLSGPAVQKEEPLPHGVLLSADKFVAGKVLVGQRLMGLAVGATEQFNTRQLALGSAAVLMDVPLSATRAADATITVNGSVIPARTFELTEGPKSKGTLWLDAQGWLLGLEFRAWGSTVEMKRVK